jgi:hypothetical protein
LAGQVRPKDRLTMLKRTIAMQKIDFMEYVRNKIIQIRKLRLDVNKKYNLLLIKKFSILNILIISNE